MDEIDFQNLRDQWALKAPLPTKDRVALQLNLDRNANPHNDPYHNKKPRRSETQIVSDLAYTFADEVLIQQYGTRYTLWLKDHFYEEKWGVIRDRLA
jgi:hypothetical protein